MSEKDTFLVVTQPSVPCWILNDSTDELYMALNFDCLTGRERELTLAEIKRRATQEKLNKELRELADE